MKIKLVDGSIYQVARADITNSRLEIDFKDMTSEEIYEIFSKPSNLGNIELLTDNNEKYSDIPGWTKLAGVMLIDNTNTVILTQAIDIIEERLIAAESDALKARTIAEDLKENGVPFEQNAVLSASVMVARVSAQTLDDAQALRAKAIYSTWEELVFNGYVAAEPGYKFIYNGNLYKTVNEGQRFQDEWVPGEGTESIFIRIDEVHTGTFEDPIPAKPNMEYIKGFYYIESGQVYKMNRVGMEDGESIILQFFPSELTGQYFEIVDIRHTI